MLELINIYKSFGEQKVLRGLNLTLEQAKIHTLIGGNGSGKTTLFNLITGFLKTDSGEIRLDGKRIDNKGAVAINKKGITRTFQDLRLITKLTVKENVILAIQNNPTDNWLNAMLPQSLYNNSNKVLSEIADEILEQFFLNSIKDSLAGEISYGQQKLLTLACCVANGTTLLLLDEAVAGIQPEYRNKIAILIKQLKERGKTIFLIEHNTDFITEVTDKIFFLNEGRISSFENIETLRKDKRVMEAYI